MAERIQTGQYLIGEVEDTPRRDPPKRIGVIKGERLNNSRGGGFGRHMGVSKTKWFVYEQVEYLREYYDRSGTGVLDVVSLVSEHSSKSEAVEAAERLV